MLPVSRALSAYLVTGHHDKEKLSTENLGHVHAFDPERHVFVATGLTLQMAERLENYYIREGSYCYPKWEGFKRLKFNQLSDSYRAQFG